MSSSKSVSVAKRRIPVILDTDIGGDIDDTWALALLIQSPEFDVKLITTSVDDTVSKARTVAKFLQIVGRTDIPIGIGVRQNKCGRGDRQSAWADDYEMSSYPCAVFDDGVQAIIDTIMNNPEPMKLIAIGPLPNIAAALEREPRIAQKAQFVGMHGSIRSGYDGSSEIDPEYNVVVDVTAAKKVFTAPWKMTITPLDTCGFVQLKREKYQKVLQRNSPLTRALIENYRAWQKQMLLEKNKDLSEVEIDKKVTQRISSSSTTLFDTVAIYLAMSSELVKMEELTVRITDGGYTKIDDEGKMISCATKWNDLAAFGDYLVTRLTK